MAREPITWQDILAVVSETEAERDEAWAQLKDLELMQVRYRELEAALRSEKVISDGLYELEAALSLAVGLLEDAIGCIGCDTVAEDPTEPCADCGTAMDNGIAFLATDAAIRGREHLERDKALENVWIRHACPGCEVCDIARRALQADVQPYKEALP